MTSKKLLIEVELVPVVVSIIAEPGDKLMMLNGLCIGVDTSREDKASWASHRPRLGAPEPVPVAPARIEAPRKAEAPRKRRHRKGEGGSRSRQIREIIMAKLNDVPQHRTELIGPNMSKPDQDIFSYVIQRMKRAGILIAVRPGYFKRANSTWTKADIAPPEPEPESAAELVVPKREPYRDMRVLGYTDLKDYGIYKSRDALNAMIKTGHFPASMKISPGRIAWRTSEVEAWVAQHKKSA